MQKICQNCEKEFTLQPEDFSFYEKMSIPAPTWCSECRLIRRMSYRNERSLYKRKCQATGHEEDMLTIFSPDKIDTVYCHSAWWGDNWDPMDYERDYNFSHTFFEQMHELWKDVPDVGLFNLNSVHSDYCSITEGNKNCYLVIAGDFNENTSYSSFIFNSRECIDCYIVSKSEWGYELVDCISCSKLLYSQYCENCYDSFFLFNCRNCHDCFGCINLNNQQYCIFNEQYTKEEYFEKLKEFNIGSYKKIKNIYEEFKKFNLKFPRCFAKIVKSVDVSGDFIEESKKCMNCFSVFGGAENSKYLWLIYSKLKDCYDLDHSGQSSMECCDSSIIYPGNKIFFSRFIFNCHNIEYSYNCHSSSYLFGCVGLRNKQYCIFNKQYTKEKFVELREKIIKQMYDLPYADNKGRLYSYGEFFPTDLSPFCYNETVAQDLKPLNKIEIENSGYKYKDEPERNPVIQIEWNNLPDNISDVRDNIAGSIISCEHNGLCNDKCTKAFKITSSELIFYKKLNIPLPHLCPNCRSYNLFKQKNPLKLWHRSCMKEGCKNEFETPFSPERLEIIYCKSCYQKEVY